MGAQRPPEPGGRHRARRSRADAAARSSRHQAAGWDADQAIAALYREHYRSLARIAALLLGDGELAEKIAQDAFVSVFCAWGQLRDGDEALRHLRRAVISLARSHAAASPCQPGLPHGLAVGQRPAPGPAEAAFMAALRGLPAPQREALVLRYYAGWPDPQIAASMGISGRALNAYIRRGMSALQARADPDSNGA
jgi:DNA-directed RNA polymerase specialized sigma24 family protein